MYRVRICANGNQLTLKCVHYLHCVHFIPPPIELYSCVLLFLKTRSIFQVPNYSYDLVQQS